MDCKEIAILIAKLKEENKSNSKEEKEFNERWIKCLYKAMAKSI